MTLIRIFERKVLNRVIKNITRLKINLHCNNDFVDEAKNYLVSHYEKMNSLKVTKSIDNPNMSKITAIIEIINKRPIKHIYHKLEKLEGITSISVEALNDK